MKILIISRYCTLPSWQGSAKHAQSFASALLLEGHKVELISGENVDTYDTINQEGYKVHRIPLPQTKGKLEHFTGSAIRVQSFIQLAEEIINTFNPDVVHVGVFGKMGPFIEVAKRKKLPITAMVHDYTWLCLSKFLIDHKNRPCSGPDSFEKCYACVVNQLSLKRKILVQLVDTFPFIKNLLPDKISMRVDAKSQIKNALSYYDSLLSQIDLFFVQNHDSAFYYKQAGVDDSKIIFIQQGLVEEKLIKRTKRKEGVGVLNIGFIGRISHEKGIDILMKALSKIDDKSPIKLTIISKGVTVDKINEIGGALPSDLVIELKNDIRSVVEFTETIAQLDLFVASSTCRETGPRTIMEAIAQGVPSIVSDVVGNKYLIDDGANGKVVKAGDVEGLFREIMKIIENPSVLTKWIDNLPELISETERTKKLVDIHKGLMNKTI